MRDGTPPQYRERFSAGQPERDSNRVLGLGAGFGLTPLSPGGRGVGGEGDVLELHHSHSSGRSGHLLPPGEKGKTVQSDGGCYSNRSTPSDVPGC